jgi:chaperonin cofactor prefoldin
MDARIDKIRERINKLTEQQHKIEEKYITTVARLVKNMASKGIDIKILTGMILDAERVISDSSDKKEVWKKSGERFLFRSKSGKTSTGQSQDNTTQE